MKDLVLDKALFSSQMKKHQEKLLMLYKSYQMALMGREVQYQQLCDIEDSVLKEHPFYSAYDCENRKSGDVKKGDRILSTHDTYLLCENDFDTFLHLSSQKKREAGLVDSDGYYHTDWLSVLADTRTDLVTFIIDEILPKSLADIFRPVKTNIVYQMKLIKCFESSLK